MLREENKPAVRVRVCGDLARFVDEDDLAFLATAAEENSAPLAAAAGEKSCLLAATANVVQALAPFGVPCGPEELEFEQQAA